MTEPVYKSAKPGTKLAGYEVLAEIGRGAASIIYCVQDTKTKHIWALKHVEKHSAKEQRFIDQAMGEYEIAKVCRHPRIRSIERVIKSRAGLMQLKELFLLMEYVDGVSLERELPGTFEEAVDIFIQTADGLAFMHSKGYAHADMKPNNIVVNDRGEVKIIDLGQGCSIGTVKERIQGTPDYIAPEQVHRRAITGFTDVYNLGATMYWVLTQRNIPTALPQGDSLVDSLEDSMIDTAPPVRSINPRCPLSLSVLIEECIEVKPEHRPEGGMSEVLERLREIREELRSGTNAA